jgi:hypothetical protein
LADAASVSPDILTQFLPKIDPMLAFAVVLGILFLLFIIVSAVVFLILVKKNWIVLNWPYRVFIFKPSGTTILRFEDKAAPIKTDNGKIMFKLKKAGFDIEIPDREYILPGNELNGWSSTMREFIPIKPNFVGFKKSPDPRVIEKIMLIKDEKMRNKYLADYDSKLKTMEMQWQPKVDNATINSVIENTANIVKNTPMKLDWLVWVGVGAAIMVIIVTFMISVMMQMKNSDEVVKGYEVGKAQADALAKMADTMNQTNTINAQLANILNRSVINIAKGT